MEVPFAVERLLSVGRLFIDRLLPTLDPGRADLTGKTAVVTGANSGIGLALASAFADQGATVYLGCRNESKAQNAIEQIVKLTPSARPRLHFLQLDTSDTTSVKAAADRLKSEVKKIDILAHNAGISTPTGDKLLSPQGFDIVYATNFLGSFLLTYYLEDRLSRSARVIFTTSHGQYSARFSRGFTTERVTGRSEAGFHYPKVPTEIISVEGAYGNTKSMQCLFARLLQQRFDSQRGPNGERRIAAAFTPGFTSTPIFGKTEYKEWRSAPTFAFLALSENIIATDVKQGAATGVYLATSHDEVVTDPKNGGGYWDRMWKKRCSADFLSEEMRRKFWKRWENDAGVEWS